MDKTLINKLSQFRLLVKAKNDRWFPELVLYGDGSGQLNICKFSDDATLFNFGSYESCLKLLEKEISKWTK